jgi:hypothetical protein
MKNAKYTPSFRTTYILKFLNQRKYTFSPIEINYKQHFITKTNKRGTPSNFDWDIYESFLFF